MAPRPTGAVGPTTAMVDNLRRRGAVEKEGDSPTSTKSSWRDPREEEEAEGAWGGNVLLLLLLLL